MAIVMASTATGQFVILLLTITASTFTAVTTAATTTTTSNSMGYLDHGKSTIASLYLMSVLRPTLLEESNLLICSCAAFHSDKCGPAFTWTFGYDSASLWNCSQPKVGLQANCRTANEYFCNKVWNMLLPQMPFDIHHQHPYHHHHPPICHHHHTHLHACNYHMHN